MEPSLLTSTLVLDPTEVALWSLAFVSNRRHQDGEINVRHEVNAIDVALSLLKLAARST